MSETKRMLRSLLTERSRLKAQWDRLGTQRQSLEPTGRALTLNAIAIADLDLSVLLERERSATDDAHRQLLLLMLENVPVGVSSGNILIGDREFPAPDHLCAALASLMEEAV